MLDFMPRPLTLIDNACQSERNSIFTIPSIRIGFPFNRETDDLLLNATNRETEIQIIAWPFRLEYIKYILKYSNHLKFNCPIIFSETGMATLVFVWTPTKYNFKLPYLPFSRRTLRKKLMKQVISTLSLNRICSTCPRNILKRRIIFSDINKQNTGRTIQTSPAKL